MYISNKNDTNFTEVYNVYFDYTILYSKHVEYMY